MLPELLDCHSPKMRRTWGGLLRTFAKQRETARPFAWPAGLTTATIAAGTRSSPRKTRLKDAQFCAPRLTVRRRGPGRFHFGTAQNRRILHERNGTPIRVAKCNGRSRNELAPGVLRPLVAKTVGFREIRGIAPRDFAEPRKTRRQKLPARDSDSTRPLNCCGAWPYTCKTVYANWPELYPNP
jgi:hypothetical protein